MTSPALSITDDAPNHASEVPSDALNRAFGGIWAAGGRESPGACVERLDGRCATQYKANSDTKTTKALSD